MFAVVWRFAQIGEVVDGGDGAGLRSILGGVELAMAMLVERCEVRTQPGHLKRHMADLIAIFEDCISHYARPKYRRHGRRTPSAPQLHQSNLGILDRGSSSQAGAEESQALLPIG